MRCQSVNKGARELEDDCLEFTGWQRPSDTRVGVKTVSKTGTSRMADSFYGEV